MTRAQADAGRLWLSSTGEVVCETQACAGEKLMAAIKAARNMQNSMPGDNGVKYHVLNDTDVREMGELMARSGGEFRCKCGRVRYAPGPKTVQITERPSLYR